MVGAEDNQEDIPNNIPIVQTTAQNSEQELLPTATSESTFTHVQRRHIPIHTPGRVLTYSQVKEVILGTTNPRNQAILAFAYGFACRAGELAKVYMHQYSRGQRVVETGGPTIGSVDYSLDAKGRLWIRFRKPNFKQVVRAYNKSRTKSFWLASAKEFVTPIVRENEPWLAGIVHEWVMGKESSAPLFNLRECAIRKVVRTEIGRLYHGVASHSLRHSRATHYAQWTHNPFVVKALLGHARIETSMKYVSYLETAVNEAFESRAMDESLTGK